MDGSGTPDDPGQLTTAPGSSSYTMHRDEGAEPRLLVCQVGSTRLTYLLRAIEDLYVPPLLEGLGLVELEHDPRNNRVRAS